MYASLITQENNQLCRKTRRMRSVENQFLLVVKYYSHLFKLIYVFFSDSFFFSFLSAWPNFRKQNLKVLKNNGEWRTKSQVFRNGYRSNSSISRPNVAFSPLLFSNDEEFEFSETGALLIIPEEFLVSLVKLIQNLWKVTHFLFTSTNLLAHLLAYLLIYLLTQTIA